MTRRKPFLKVNISHIHPLVLAYSLGSGACVFFILGGRGCGRGDEEGWVCVVGVAAVSRVDGGQPLVERRVLLPVIRNVAVAVLF